MKAFRVHGKFLMGRDVQPFTQEVAAEDAEGAVEVVLSTLGSRHRVPRKRIQVASVDPLPRKEVSDPVVAYLLERK